MLKLNCLLLRLECSTDTSGNRLENKGIMDPYAKKKKKKNFLWLSTSGKELKPM